MSAVVEAPPPAATESLSLQELLAQVTVGLQAVLPPENLITNAERTTPYECDGLTAYRQRPLAVALPSSYEQIQSVLQTCHRLGVPVVARGAGTGLSGGAMPHERGVTLSLAKFNQILKIDPLARTATVQCGVRNLPSAKPPPRTACTTRPTRRARSPAPSAATWPKTLAACTV